jgi:hypothetical protein
MQKMYAIFVHYRFLIFLWMKPPCCWHTVMTVTVPLNEITGMWRLLSVIWSLTNTFFFLGRGGGKPWYRPGQALRGSWWMGLPHFKTIRTWRWPGCQPYELAAFTRKEIFLVLVSVTGWVNSSAIVWLEGWSQRKTAMIFGHSEYTICWYIICLFIVNTYECQLLHKI